MDILILLLLCLFSVLKIEGSEYFVIPNERGYGYCPGWPCLSIDQLSDHFSNSSEVTNTTFNFLPETYVLTKPMYINDAANLFFNGMQSTILVQWNQTGNCFKQRSLCISVLIPELEDRQEWCCSMFRLTNVEGIKISNFHLEVVEDISGLIIEDSHNISIENLHFIANHTVNNVGLLLSKDTHTFVTNVEILGMEVGVVMVYSVTIALEDTKIEASGIMGIYVWGSHDIKLKMLTLVYNPYCGLYLIASGNIIIENVNTTLGENGIFILVCTKISISMISVSNCQEKALFLNMDETVYIGNVTVIDASIVEIYESNLLSVANMNLLNTSLVLLSSTVINFSFVSITKSYEGVNISRCGQVNMSEITVKENLKGIVVEHSHNVLLFNVALELNSRVGVRVTDCFFISVVNVTLKNNQWSGLEIQISSEITIFTASVVNNSYQGIHLTDCYNAKLHTIIVDNNALYGLQIVGSSYIEVVGVNATSNGILVYECSNVTLSHVKTGSINQPGIFFLHCSNINLKNSTFCEIFQYPTQSQKETGLEYSVVVSTHNSTIKVVNCQFIGNYVSSVHASGTYIEIEGNNLFENISSKLGAGFILSDNSQLILSEECNIIFKNNVTEYGGAIHIETNQIADLSTRIDDIVYSLPAFSVSSYTQCFLRVEGDRTNTARLTFINNTAEKGGDVLYGGLVATGYDGDWNCLLSFKNISDMTTQSREQPFRRITSDPSRVCICGEEGPDCLTVVDPAHHSVYPGQTLTLSAAVVGQDFGTVTGYVYAQFLKPSPHVVEQDQQWIYFSNAAGCQELRYTINSPCEDCETVLVLTTERDRIVEEFDEDINDKLSMAWSLLLSDVNYNKQAIKYLKCLVNYDTSLDLWFYSDNYEEIVEDTIDGFYRVSADDSGYGYIKLIFPQQIYKYPFYVYVDIQTCPVGFSLIYSQCDCNSILQVVPKVVCDIEMQTVSHDGSVWVGFYGNDTLAVSDYCPLNYCKRGSVQVYLNSSDTDSQCNYKHSGVLCGGCPTGLSLALGSDQCLHCSNHYLFLMLVFPLAGLTFVFVIKFLDLTVKQGTINGFILYANVIGANKHLFYNQKSINPLTLFIAWFNLDLGIETCLYDGLTAYSRTWLQFVFPVYLWFIAGAIIIIAKYSRRFSALSGNNGVPVLATIFLLSYTKLLNIIISTLSYTILQTIDGPKYVWSIDGNIDYLSLKHLPLFVAAVLVLVFLWLPYTFLLLLGKYLHKLNCQFVMQKLLRLKPFLDANYAPLDDRHQYWFGVTLAVKAAVLLASRTLPKDSTLIFVFSITVTSVVLLFWGQLVYKNRALSLLHTSFFMNLAILNATKLLMIQWQNQISISSFTLIGISFTVFIGMTLFKQIEFIASKLNCILGRRNEAVEHEHIVMVAINRANISDDSSEESSSDSSDNESY